MDRGLERPVAMPLRGGVNMVEHLRIGELAQRTGKSIHALRYYESIGLIPFVRRDAGGRRQYDAQHVEWLFLLERLQRTGMTLSQMQEYALLASRGKQTMTRRMALLEEHLHQIDRQMAELARSRELLVAKLDFYRDWQASGKRPAASWLNAPEAAGQATKSPASRAMRNR
jgi:DNA-binding transcriptional MerR regulator